MSAVGHSRARNIRFGVLIVSDATTLILSDAQHASAGRRHRLRDLAGGPFAIGRRQVTVTECNQQAVAN